MSPPSPQRGGGGQGVRGYPGPPGLTEPKVRGRLAAMNVNVNVAPIQRGSRATIRDIARLAGCSVNTVSRALNGKGEVSPDTRARIQQIAADLGYAPNSVARSLVSRRTHTIGVLLPDATNPNYGFQWQAMQTVLDQQGYVLMVLDSMRSAARARSILTRLRERRVDGLLMLSPDVPAEMLHRFEADGVPVVLVNRYLPGEPFDYVVADNRSGAYEATRHLIEHGHRSIVHITTERAITTVRDRLDGFHAALREAGAEHQGRVVVAELTLQGGYDAARAMLARGERPSAVLAYNDFLAMGVIRAFKEHGVRIPDDVALVSFDDSYFAGYLAPSLTTVRLPIVAIAERAAAMLLARLGGTDRSAPQQFTLPVHLVIRESCGCAAEERRVAGGD